MRHIDRLDEPKILAAKHEEWQKKFNEARKKNPSVRPDAKKYGDDKIREALMGCSYGKCFYCESSLKGESSEIDHFVEVSVKPQLAYTWTNLYLSCHNCNDKKSPIKIPAEDVLDPCIDSDQEIQSHIYFEKECIVSQSGSDKGLKTIQKFKLNSDFLDLKRGKWLRKIWEQAGMIMKQMIVDGRKETTEEERNQLLRYMQADQPYSLMSKIYIKENFAHLLGGSVI